MMNLDQLRQILSLVREHELTELEIEQDGLRLKIRKDTVPAPIHHSSPPPIAHAAPPSAVPAIAAAPAAADSTPPADAEIELAVVKSPIVGTFYRSPEPGAQPFVEVGATVKKGQVLCIIEAMKLMNEIEAKVGGRIARVLVENGQPVEYGQALFLVEPR